MLGELVRVSTDRAGVKFTVRLDDGEVIKFTPEAGQHIDHGYAVTTHKAQGVTVDATYVLAGSMNDRELSYVQLSRHRDEARLYVPQAAVEDELRAADLELTGNAIEDLKSLVRQMERSGQKETTLDYIEIAQESQALSLAVRQEEELEL